MLPNWQISAVFLWGAIECGVSLDTDVNDPYRVRIIAELICGKERQDF
jgi:hypothetical protein